MKLVVTHEQPDFDALASLALARLAHPGSVAVVTGSLSPRLRDAIRLYRDELNLLDATDVDTSQVSELIVVDTNDPERIRPFDQLIGKVPITLYDHHTSTDSSMPASQGLQEPVGATATILTRHLRASNTPIPASIATLALLGIHEDTGNFTYSATTAADHDAAGLLHRSGANLEFVVEYASDPLGEEQRQLLQQLLQDSNVILDGERRIVTASLRLDAYVAGTSALVSQLLALHGADAAVVATGFDGDTEVFARVARGYDAAQAFQEAFGTGGHPGAAFARVELEPRPALEKALESLYLHRSELLTASDLMSTPVTTIPVNSTVDQATQILRRHGHNGAPVVDEDGQLQGVVSRRDLDHALKFDMHDASVTGFMNRTVITASPADTLVQLESNLIQHAIGRLPVLGADGTILGIVTRSDLLAARHASPRQDLAERVMDRMPTMARKLIDTAIGLLPGHARLYLVGGIVRDALLGRSLSDLDVAVDGVPATMLAQALQKKFGGEIITHEAFGTTTLRTEKGMLVDIAGTRLETYAHPGALPEVSPGPISRDLQRRDYTINAIAVQVSPQPPRLLDPLGGIDDLERRQLRLLHPLSFLEDPTRVLRGARLAARLGFQFDRDSLDRARQVMTPEVLDRMAPARLRNELELALDEPRLEPVFAQLEHTGALEAMFGLEHAPELLEALDAQKLGGSVRSEAALFALLLETSAGRAEAHMRRFSWPASYRQSLERLRHVREEAELLTEEILGRMSAAERELVRCFSERHRELTDAFRALPQRRRLRGSDVLELGVPAGPAVGRILAQVARARQTGKVQSFEQELELARTLTEQAGSAEPARAESGEQ